MSQFWQRKMRTFFHLMDFDKDGVIWKRDFELKAEGFSAAEKVDPVKQEKLRKRIADSWLIYTGSTETDQKEYLTAAMLIDNLKKQINDPKVKTRRRDSCLSFLGAMDTDEDGYIQPAEFRRFYENFGIHVPDTSFSEQAFKAIDSNHDGKLSFDEFTDTFLEFMLSENEDSPCNLMFGPLIQA